MQLSLIDIFLSDGAARAVCWTLVHSLWEGVLAAVLAGFVIGYTRKLPATLRYNLLAADLLLFLLVTGATFLYEIRQGDNLMMPTGGIQIADGDKGRIIPHLRQDISVDFAKQENFILRAADFFNTHASLVTLIWLACLSMQMLRLTGGLYQVSRLRLNSVAPPGEFWNERLSVLAARLGIKRAVTLLQSELLRTPAAFGFLKPSILVPLGMLANLPPDQVEAILLHELAHIRRGDFISNLLLHLIESIFFFNPGVRWIAVLIRQERETCCDDIVLSGTGDRDSYFEALVVFTQVASDGRIAGGRALTLQLSDGRTDLLWRIRRMIEHKNRNLLVMEKAILSFGLMVIVSVSLISMKGKSNQAANYHIPMRVIGSGSAAGPVVIGAAQTPGMRVMVDTPPRRREQDTAGRRPILNFRSVTSHTSDHEGQKKYYARAIDDQGNRYEISKLDDNITELRVNRVLVRKEDYEQYENVFAGFEVAQQSHPPAAPVAHAASVLPAESAAPARAIGSAGPASAQGQTASAAQAHMASPAQAATPAQDRPAEPVDPNEVAPTLDNPLVYTKEPNPYIIRIIADLVENRLIDHVDKLSFTLDADGLIVNGLKQPEDIYVKYRSKYIRHTKDHFIYSQYYTRHGSGSHCEVSTDSGNPLPETK